MSRLGSESSEEKEDDERVHQLVKQAKAAFTHIQACMTSAEAAPAFLRALVQVGVEEAALRDELWCQLIKQTTDCHDSRAMALGVKAIALLLPAFQPSPPLYRILLSHVAALCPATLTGVVSAASDDEGLWHWRPVSDFAVLVFLLHNYHQQQTCNRCVQPSLADIKLILGDRDLPASSADLPPFRLTPSAHPPAVLTDLLASNRASTTFSSSPSARSSIAASKNSSLVFSSNPLFSSSGSGRSSIVASLLLTLPPLPSAPPPPRPSANATLPAYFPSTRRAAATRGSLTWSAGQSQEGPLGVNVAGELIEYCDLIASEQQQPYETGEQKRRLVNTPQQNEEGALQQWDESELQRRLSALLGTVDDSDASLVVESSPPAPSLAPPAAPPLDDIIPAAPPPLSPSVPLVSTGTQTDAVLEDSDTVQPAAPPIAPPFAPALSASDDVPCAPSLLDGPLAAPSLDIPCAPPLLAPSIEVVIGADAPPPPPPPSLSSVPTAPRPPSASNNGRNDIIAAIRAAKAKTSSSAASSSSGNSRADMLAAIRAGPKLRKVGAADDQPTDAEADKPPLPAAVAAAVPTDPRDEMMAAIRAGGKLKKVGAAAASITIEAGAPPTAPPPPPSAPSAAGSTGDPRSELLKAIQGGVKLRKVSEAAASTGATTADVPPAPVATVALVPPTDTRSELLRAIQGGVKLKKMAASTESDSNTAPPAPPAPPAPSHSSLSSSAVSTANNPQDELLRAIRGGVKLRKAPTTAADGDKQQSPSTSDSHSRSVTLSVSPSQSSQSASAIPVPPSPTSVGTSGSSSRSGSSVSQPFDLQSALSSALFRRKSRMQYDTLRTLTSPLSSSLSSSPTQPSRRLTAINDAFDDEEPAIQLDPAPIPHDTLTTPDDAPPPPGPPTDCAPATKPIRVVSKATPSAVDPREQLLAAIRGGARLQSVSARPVSDVRPPPPAHLAGRHERSASSLSEVVGVASSMYHNRLGSVSVNVKPVGVELKRAAVAARQAGGAAGERGSGSGSGSVSSSGANSELAALLKKRQQKIAEAAAAPQ